MIWTKPLLFPRRLRGGETFIMKEKIKLLLSGSPATLGEEGSSLEGRKESGREAAD